MMKHATFYGCRILFWYNFVLSWFSKPFDFDKFSTFALPKELQKNVIVNFHIVNFFSLIKLCKYRHLRKQFF